MFLSVTTLDRSLARKMEPRAPTPEKRHRGDRGAQRRRRAGGRHGRAVIPAVNDSEIETILTRAYAAGAREGGLCRAAPAARIARHVSANGCRSHFPDRLNRSVSLVQSMRGGKDYEAAWGRRMAGSGPYAWMIGRRFEMAARRLGFREERRPLRTDLFVRPSAAAGARKAEGAQLSLF